MNEYDEDILQNPFYKALTTKGKQLYQHATDNRWTVCIPRKGTTSRSSFNNEYFEMHLLRLLNEKSSTYITANGKEVQINGSFIVTTKGFSDVKSIQILFEETFFNRDEKSYHMLCINQPLEGGTFATHTEPVIQRLETLENCKDFLWPKGGARKSQKQINELLSLFNSTYTRLASESVRHTVDAANAVFTKAMQACLKESHIRRPAIANKLFMDNVKVAVETYLMDGIYKRVFKGISFFLTEEDASFNKTTRNLADLQIKDLGINKQLCKSIPKAKKILSNLNKFTTPLEKLYILKLTIASMSDSSTVREEDNLVTADDLLPALVFLIVKSDIPNWLTNLSYMSNFHFSRSKSDEFQFYLTSTEAAIKHIRTGRLDNLISMTHIQRLQMMSILFKKSDDQDNANGPSPVEIFFENIRANRTEEVMKILKESARTMKHITELMCHPLCSCDDCEKLMSGKRKDTSAVTVFSRDDIGCTALHHAAEFGCTKIIYELIKKEAVVNATNYHGTTPLHLACQRGHNIIAVILVHYGGDINAVDNGSNSPLHLAVENGHELCVDYLCSTECEADAKAKLDIDAVDEHGDTALHIASRWGFGSSVYILLEAGASIDIVNKDHMTPRLCALNVKIQEILLKGTNDEQKVSGYVYLPPANEPTDFDPQQPLPSGLLIQADSPNTSKRKTELTKLLKAVADGDIELVRHKLGIIVDNEISAEDDPDLGRVEDMLCHPLCQCEKCSKLQKRVVSESVSVNANMSNKDGITALHIAALHGFEKIVALLLKHAGAEPNVKTNTNQRSPLHLACQYNNIESVSLLLKHGARANVKDVHGNTPLHFCCTNGHIGPAILVLQGGGNVHSVNHRGNTPLHDAARWNFVDIARLLLHYKAKTDVKNKMHLTPIQYAVGEDVISLLQGSVKKHQQSEEMKIPKRQNTSTISFPSFSSNDEDLFVPDEIQAKARSSVSSQEKVNLLSEKINTQKNNGKLRKNMTPVQCTSIDNSRIENNVKNKNCFHSTDESNKTSTHEAYFQCENHQPRRTTIANLFEALEEENLARLKKIADDIKAFDRRKSLRRVSTIDRSCVYLEQMKTLVSIQQFDHDNLKHVDTLQETIAATDAGFQKLSESVDCLSSEQSTINSESKTTILYSKTLSQAGLYRELTDTSTEDASILKCNNIQTINSLQSPKNIATKIEDWFEHELQTDSADEITEETLDFVMHSEGRSNSGRIADLITEAIDDESSDHDHRPEFREIGPIQRVLSEDDILFADQD